MEESMTEFQLYEQMLQRKATPSSTHNTQPIELHRVPSNQSITATTSYNSTILNILNTDNIIESNRYSTSTAPDNNIQPSVTINNKYQLDQLLSNTATTAISNTTQLNRPLSLHKVNTIISEHKNIQPEFIDDITDNDGSLNNELIDSITDDVSTDHIDEHELDQQIQLYQQQQSHYSHSTSRVSTARTQHTVSQNHLIDQPQQHRTHESVPTTSTLQQTHVRANSPSKSQTQSIQSHNDNTEYATLSRQSSIHHSNTSIAQQSPATQISRQSTPAGYMNFQPAVVPQPTNTNIRHTNSTDKCMHTHNDTQHAALTKQPSIQSNNDNTPLPTHYSNSHQQHSPYINSRPQSTISHCFVKPLSRPLSIDTYNDDNHATIYAVPVNIPSSHRSSINNTDTQTTVSTAGNSSMPPSTQGQPSWQTELHQSNNTTIQQPIKQSIPSAISKSTTTDITLLLTQYKKQLQLIYNRYTNNRSLMTQKQFIEFCIDYNLVTFNASHTMKLPLSCQRAEQLYSTSIINTQSMACVEYMECLVRISSYTDMISKHDTAIDKLQRLFDRIIQQPLKPQAQQPLSPSSIFTRRIQHAHKSITNHQYSSNSIHNSNTSQFSQPMAAHRHKQPIRAIHNNSDANTTFNTPGTQSTQQSKSVHNTPSQYNRNRPPLRSIHNTTTPVLPPIKSQPHHTPVPPVLPRQHIQSTPRPAPRTDIVSRIPVYTAQRQSIVQPPASQHSVPHSDNLPVDRPNTALISELESELYQLDNKLKYNRYSVASTYLAQQRVSS